MKFQEPGAAIFTANASKTQGRSLQSFLASLSVAGAIFGVEILLFLILRIKLPHVYRPKIHNSSDNVPSIFGISDLEIIEKCGLDAYLFLRYLKVLLRIFIPLALLILPILVPINFVGGRGPINGVHGLDQLSWTNISPARTNRYWAHSFLALLVVLWVCFVAHFELQSYTRLRQTRLTSLGRSKTALGTTILVTDVPQSLLTVRRLTDIYNVYPGGVRQVSIHRNYSKLADQVQKREQLALKLESAQTRLIQKIHMSQKTDQSEVLLRATKHSSTWKDFLPVQDRETISLPIFKFRWCPSIPFLSKKVDVIDYCRKELQSLNVKILDDQQNPDRFETSHCAFIRFNRPIGAHMACQSIQHPQPYSMTPKHVEESPCHIIWKNVSMTWWERYLRTTVIGSLVIVLFLIATVPVAFTGLLSQLTYLTTVFSSLDWLEKLPNWFLAALQGILPSCLLATVMIALPQFLQFLIPRQGGRTRIVVELQTQDYYFWFLFIQIFGVVSASSSVAAVLNGMTRNFESTAALLAQNLPKAANYFFSYLLLQGLSVSAGTLLQISHLMQFASVMFLDNTAREKWERRRETEMRWGTFFPVYTNLAVIGLIYCIVSPLILIFNILVFTLFLAVQQYNMINVSRFSFDTGGLIYSKAINQLFVGLYAMELYLTVLFFLVRDSSNRFACVGQAVIMILMTTFTAAYQILLNRAYKPFFSNLPVMLDKVTTQTHTRSNRPRESKSSWLELLHSRFAKLLDVAGRLTEEEMSASEDFQVTDVIDEIQDVALKASQPVIWIPRDKFGVSSDEIRQTQSSYSSILISDKNARLNEKGAVVCSGDPPESSDQ